MNSKCATRARTMQFVQVKRIADTMSLHPRSITSIASVIIHKKVAGGSGAVFSSVISNIGYAVKGKIRNQRIQLKPMRNIRLSWILSHTFTEIQNTYLKIILKNLLEGGCCLSEGIEQLIKSRDIRSHTCAVSF